MTLNEQHAYVLKIEQRCKELGYRWKVIAPTYYDIYKERNALTASIYLAKDDNYIFSTALTDWFPTNLPEFLDTHFQDMLNSTNEERTMWELETGTEWIF